MLGGLSLLPDLERYYKSSIPDSIAAAIWFTSTAKNYHAYVTVIVGLIILDHEDPNRTSSSIPIIILMINILVLFHKNLESVSWYYVDRGYKYRIKTFLRNHKIYEWKVYIDGKLLLHFRDSYTLVPRTLEELGKTLCPELGSKGGVMLKAQDIILDKYHMDIVNVMILSSLYLKLIRQNYLDDNAFHINLPTRNQDTFIRRGFYGGHVDVYKPYGKFIGFYYSEELKFARNLGYHIIPLRGYLFEKKDSPFKGFVSHLYESRLESKKSGDKAMSYLYKILMNSLYGRFGINPESTVTEICNQKKYEDLMKKDNFQTAEKLTNHYYIINYITNKNSMTDDTE
ncbi:hypothetical protein FXO38_17513 [Capsicum annuum]|uniref:DNA-directed DNA polymerase n=1 Tax=Capsicum annuum TaxID=4072 RepID=A0A2G2YEA5_CAPAN|nr:hypothetical protein FXO38_17513 [Capsicum annuum]PHT68077.1 hypothetical protein T459_27564 [Capsicum annuum]